MPFRSSTLELLNSQIHYKQLEYCEGFDPITKSVLEGLLSKWHLSRLGGTEKDGVEIMHHPFFCDISWPDLLDQKVIIFFLTILRRVANCFFLSIYRLSPHLFLTYIRTPTHDTSGTNPSTLVKFLHWTRSIPLPVWITSNSKI